MDLAHDLFRLVENTGPWALPALAAASFIESVFPPFPGDSIVLFGALYAVRGILSLPAVFLTVTAGGLLGSALDFYVGRKLGAVAEHRARYRDRLERFEAAYRKRGDLIILVNRFLPGIRGFLFIAAGMVGMRFWRTMALGAVSAALWNTVLLAVGFAVGANLDRVAALLHTYAAVVWVALLLLALVLLARFVARRGPRS